MSDESGYTDVRVVPMPDKKTATLRIVEGLAKDYWMVYQVFRDVGFNEKQAMDLMFVVTEQE